TTTDLFDCWMIGGGEGWAVGAAGTLLHVRDAGVTGVAAPLVVDYHSVWARDPFDAWAGGLQGVVAHWDGTQWQRRDAGLSTSRDVTDIAGLNTNEVWLAGSGG